VSLPFLVWLLLSGIWGSTWLFIKLGLEDLPPITFAGLRFVLASIPLGILLFVRLKLKRVTLPTAARDWLLMAATGFATFTINYGLVFWGENHIPSGLTAILYTTFPLFGFLMAHFLVRGEPLTVPRLGGVLLGLAGVILIFYRQIQFEGMMALWGSAAIVLAALQTAYVNVVIKLRAGHLDPTLLTTTQMVCGFIPLLLVGIPLEGNPFSFAWTPLAWVSLFYLAWVGSALPFVLLYWLMQRMQVTSTMLISLSSTLIAVLLGWLVRGEEFGWHTLLGGMAILSGLMLTTVKRRRLAKRWTS